MKCDLTPAGLYQVWAIGFIAGMVYGHGVSSTGEAAFLALCITGLIWLVRNDGLEPRPGNWVRSQGSFWWRRLPDEPAE